MERGVKETPPSTNRRQARQSTRSMRPLRPTKCPQRTCRLNRRRWSASLVSPSVRRRRSLTNSLAWSALLIAGVRIVAGLILERTAYGVFGYLGPTPSPVLRPENRAITDGFLHWDAGYYLEIARHGYTPGVPRLAAFYPLYPYLARAVTKISTVSRPRPSSPCRGSRSSLRCGE